MTLRITHLYPELLNTYGDRGNIIALMKRAEWRGIKVTVRRVSLGDPLKAGETDWYFIGGGQDAAQLVIADDLTKRAQILKSDIAFGVPLLAICGGYQLLGQHYVDPTGQRSAGIGLFDITTEAGSKRLVGNILIDGIGEFANQQFIGFENHAGRTQLGSSAQPLGRVIQGFGNNGDDRTEGVFTHHAIGTYLHGSLLPKNPWLTDWFIQTALEQSQASRPVILKPLDNTFEDQARTEALGRFT